MWIRFWEGWSSEQRLNAIKIAKRQRNFWLLSSVLLSAWNITLASLTWHDKSLGSLAIWYLGLVLGGKSWEYGWQTHDFVLWSRER